MRVALSFDMEGISRITDVRETLAASDAYWESGRAKLHRDVVAAAEGLLAGGADEVVLLDNHGAGNPENLGGLPLPDDTRLERWHLFDLREHDVDAQLQVGYHARGGIDGFISHSYVPGLRLRVDGELISESHGRAWGGGVPLLGIVGNDRHEQTLGSLAGTPFLVVQDSRGRAAATPRYEPDTGYEAIRAFAEEVLEDPSHAPAAPSSTTLEASLPDANEAAATMEEGGWRRTGPSEFGFDFTHWSETREALNAAMAAAFIPYADRWAGDLVSPEARAAHDPAKLAELERVLLDWVNASEPEWW